MKKVEILSAKEGIDLTNVREGAILYGFHYTPNPSLVILRSLERITTLTRGTSGNVIFEDCWNFYQERFESSKVYHRHDEGYEPKSRRMIAGGLE
ncbi:MAG: hypothetical protein ABIF88_00390 [archaeon]